jgi:hypothetical protein
VNLTIRKWKHQNIRLVPGDTFQLTFGRKIVIEDEGAAIEYRVESPGTENWIFIEAAEVERLRAAAAFQREILRPLSDAEMEKMTDAEKEENEKAIALRIHAARVRETLRQSVADILASIEQASAELGW